MAANNPKTVKILSAIFKFLGAIPFLLGIGFFVGAGFTGDRQYTIAKKWPTVDAEVVRSELTHHRARSAHHGFTTVYQAHVDFQYMVGGKSYTASAGSDYSTSDYAEMKRRVDTYAPGTHHPIRFNPANPNDIRYDAGFTFGFFLAPLILGGAGMICTTTGAVLFLVGWAIGKAKVRCPSCHQTVRGSEASCPNCGAPLSPSGSDSF